MLESTCMSCVCTRAHVCLEQGCLGGQDGDVTIWAECWGAGVAGGSWEPVAASCLEACWGRWKPRLPPAAAGWGPGNTRLFLNLCTLRAPASATRPHP